MRSAKTVAIVGLLTALVGALGPTMARAADPCTISLADTVAGLGTQGTMTGCERGTDVLAITGPDGTQFTENVSIGADGSANIVLPGRRLRAAGRYVASVSGQQTAFAVIADRPDSAHSLLRTRQAAEGGSFTARAVLSDQYGNLIAGRPLALLSSNPADALASSGRETDDDGSLSWTVQAGGGAARTLSVYDLLSAKSIVGITVAADGTPIARSPLSAQLTPMGGETFGAIHHFAIKVNDAKIPVNQQFTMTIKALDASDNIVEDYTKTVVISSDDPDAEFPKNGVISFRAVDLGERVLPLGSRFLTTGTKKIIVREQDTPAIQGSVTVEVTRAGSTSDASIQILDPKDGTVVNKPTLLLQGKAPSFVNLQVIGGQGTGASDAEGVYRMEATLPAADTKALTHFTLIVTSENNQYSSAPINIIYDPVPPTITSITFNPPVGKTETPSSVTVLAHDDGGMKSVVATIGSDVIPLSETSSGTFTAQFTAPAVQTYDVAVKATDAGGNETTMLAKWTVGVKGVPQVTGLTAEGQPSAILLSWQPLPRESEVKTYTIYIAEEPGNYLYTKQVDAGVTSVKISGLTPGKPYEFAVTGTNADGQEGEKSAVARAAAVGTLLTATAGDGVIHLEWTPPTGMQVGNYILEFGTAPGQYTGKNILHGRLTSFTIPDLLDGVTYEVRLTPVWVTGKSAPELSATVHATPAGAGFHPGAGDPVPADQFPIQTNTGTVALPIDSHQPPVNSATGPPSPALWVLIGMTVLAAALVREHRLKQKLARAFVAMMDDRYSRNAKH